MSRSEENEATSRVQQSLTGGGGVSGEGGIGGGDDAGEVNGGEGEGGGGNGEGGGGESDPGWGQLGAPGVIARRVKSAALLLVSWPSENGKQVRQEGEAMVSAQKHRKVARTRDARKQKHGSKHQILHCHEP